MQLPKDIEQKISAILGSLKTSKMNASSTARPISHKYAALATR